jgi:Ca2+-binding RTX toxin-like protein
MVSLIVSPDDSKSLIVKYGYLGDEVLIEQFFNFSAVRTEAPIDAIEFADGTVWDMDYILKNIEFVINDEDNTVWQITTDDAVIDGLGGNDYLVGNIGNDHLIGGDGNDSLRGKEGNDMLVGGLGNDGLDGGIGLNSYKFSKGHGIDVIWKTEDNSQDVIVLDSSIDFSGIRYLRFGDHLVINTSDENFIIADSYYGDYIYSSEVNDSISLQSADGQLVDLQSVSIDGVYLDYYNWTNLDKRILGTRGYEHGGIYNVYNDEYFKRFRGTDKNDVIFGSNNDDFVTANEGNDYIKLFEGNDYIDTGSGINYVEPGQGDDEVYAAGTTKIAYNLGDGVDIVEASWRDFDKLTLDFSGLPKNSNIGFNFSDGLDDLIINYSDSDRVILKDVVSSGESSFSLKENIELIAGGQLYTKSQLENWIKSDFNFAPVAIDDTGFEVAFDRTLTINIDDLLSNDIDWNGDSLSIESEPSAENGLVVFNRSENTFVFTPDQNFVGEASVSYWPSDGKSTSDSEGMVRINVTQPSNDDNGDGSDGGSSGGDSVSESPEDYDYHVTGSDNAEQLYRSNQNDYIEGFGGNDQLYGLGGDDYLDGGDGDDYLDGGNGNDIQIGGNGNDQLGGDAGNDLLIGGSGNDIYVFRPGSGQDTINNSIGEDGVDWLIFTDGLTLEKLSFVREGDDLIIKVIDSTDQVTVLNWFLGNEYQIDYIQPAGGSGIPASQISEMAEESDSSSDDSSAGDGDSGSTGDDDSGGDGNDSGSDGVSQWQPPTVDDYQNHLVGTDQAEQLYRSHQSDFIEGLNGDDQLFGLGGNDFLSGDAGNDYLDGGDGDDIQFGGEGNDQLGGDGGNDLLIGGAGDDKYVFRPGSGNDVIRNEVGQPGVDWLIFTDDLTEDKLVFTREGDSLKIAIEGTSDSVTILNWYVGEEYRVDYIQPAGGSGISANAIESRVQSSKTKAHKGADSGLLIDSTLSDVWGSGESQLPDSAAVIDLFSEVDMYKALASVTRERSVVEKGSANLSGDAQLDEQKPLDWLVAL